MLQIFLLQDTEQCTLFTISLVSVAPLAYVFLQPPFEPSKPVSPCFPPTDLKEPPEPSFLHLQGKGSGRKQMT